MTNITTFNYLSNKLRVIDVDGQPWFVAADVRDSLGLQQAGTNFNYLKDYEKQVIRKSGSTSFKGHGLTIISESGLYKLIMRSDKPEAQQFQDWVTRDVLPAIRKDGGYIAGEEKVKTGELNEDELVFRAMEVMQRKVSGHLDAQIRAASAALYMA